MNCQEIKTLKHAYVDRELDLVRAGEIEHHLGGCRNCSQAYENIRTLGSALKSADLYFKAPAQLKRTIHASLGAEDKDASTLSHSHTPTLLWWRWLKLAFPVAGTALLAFLLATAFLRPSGDDRLSQEVTSSHVRSLMANTTHLTDVASSDQHTVKPWFDGKLDFAPPVRDLVERGFPLVGGRLDYLESRPVAALVYQRHNHLINLFVWPTTRNSSTTKKLTVRQGYNLVHWNDSAMTYWAVSDLNPAELRDFAELIK
jgi:anti-sigma factor RsiW